MASATTLTKHDTHVLGALFDPESSLSDVYQINSLGNIYYDINTMTHLKSIELEALESVDTAIPSDANIARTIQILSALIEEYPLLASAYNNRAEARRLSHDVETLMHRPDILNAILADLRRAIDLATPAHDPNTISVGDASVLAAAYTHKASLLYLASQIGLPDSVLGQVGDISGRSREQLEECASKNFAAGGRYGNKLAKQLAVKTNPYAKLCGNIIKEAMRRELDSMQIVPDIK